MSTSGALDLDLGFLDASTPAWKLESRFFRSKIGGKPAWLDLQHLPTAEERRCPSCQEPMSFLGQVYSPNDEEECFHRTLFVFFCRHPSCHAATSSPFKVFRSQLRRRNQFFPLEPPVESREWRKDCKASAYVKLCRACGSLGDKDCAGCKKVSYCCKQHQVADWKAGHKAECKDPGFVYNEEELTSFSLPQFELYTEPAEKGDFAPEEESDDESNVDEEEELEKFKRLEQQGETGTLDAKEVQQHVGDQVDLDENMIRFKEVVSNSPNQVLRYSKGGRPLWISSSGRLDPKDVPDCASCGGKREFEFQILPHLLVKLKFESELFKDSVDWGVLAVYTCQKSCDGGDRAYKEEFLFRQQS